MKKHAKKFKKTYVRKKWKLKFLLWIIFWITNIGIFTFLHYFVIKTLISEILHVFVCGSIVGWILFIVKSYNPKYFRKMKNLFLTLGIIGYLIAAIFDPILKPHLDRIFGISTVGTLEESFFINLIVTSMFFMGILASYFIFTKYKKK